MRNLPYPDSFFDMVVSSLAVHNISEKEGRYQALAEMVRVLKPQGKFYLIDIFHGKEYAHFFQQSVKVEKINSYSIYTYCPFVHIVEGRKL